MKVSVIIANYNGKEFIGDCLDSLLNSTCQDLEIIIVDNGSTDGSLTYLQEKYRENKKVRIIRSEKQLYFTGGCNLGAKKAKGDLLFFLNSDAIVEKNSIKELVNFMKIHGSRCLVQPKILWQDTPEIIDNIGGRYSILWGGYAVARNEKDIGQYEKAQQFDYVNATAMMLQRDFFYQLKGFNEAFRYFYEDVDLCLRAKKKGASCWYCSTARVYHKGSATFKRFLSPLRIKMRILRNRLYCLKNQ